MRVEFFAQADEADRLAGDRAHAERRAAAPVAIHPGQTTPVMPSFSSNSPRR
jgi:hypothetical protein